jgi:hypothetical protein
MLGVLEDLNTSAKSNKAALYSSFSQVDSHRDLGFVRWMHSRDTDLRACGTLFYSERISWHCNA